MTHVLFCERTGTWAAALRPWWHSARWRIKETRGLADARELLRQAPASFVVLELRAAVAEETLAWLAGLGREFPQARAAVVAARELAAYDRVAREAGAVHFLVSPRQVQTLTGIAQRHLRAVSAATWDVAEQIWAALPWGEE